MICPICKKPTTWNDNPNRPFCSERCKLIDFGNWVDEGYKVPSESDRSSDDIDTVEDEDLVRNSGELPSH